jgi:hypothetical protein
MLCSPSRPNKQTQQRLPLFRKSKSIAQNSQQTNTPDQEAEKDFDQDGDEVSLSDQATLASDYHQELTMRVKKEQPEADVDLSETPRPSNELSQDLLQIHPIPSMEAAIIKVAPPQGTEQPISHIPCDIVLVIDVSGSMGLDAPVPGEDDEATGLSVLDLVKHAANTIIETLGAQDRLGIVSFASSAKVVQRLTTMTAANKETARKRIKDLQPTDATNLWGGIRSGLDLFKESRTSNNVAAIMVLTDGQPNHM